jgi:hypothetical protein
MAEQLALHLLIREDAISNLVPEAGYTHLDILSFFSAALAKESNLN